MVINMETLMQYFPIIQMKLEIGEMLGIAWRVLSSPIAVGIYVIVVLAMIITLFGVVMAEERNRPDPEMLREYIERINEIKRQTVLSKGQQGIHDQHAQQLKAPCIQPVSFPHRRQEIVHGIRRRTPERARLLKPVFPLIGEIHHRIAGDRPIDAPIKEQAAKDEQHLTCTR